MSYRNTFSVLSFFLISLAFLVAPPCEAEHQNSLGASPQAEEPAGQVGGSLQPVVRKMLRGADAAAGGGGGGGGGGDANRSKADKPLEYAKQAQDNIQKGLDSYSSGVKALGDSFKQSLDSVSKLAPDNQDLMKSLRSSVDAINNSSPVGSDIVSQITSAIDADGQTQINTMTKMYQAFSYGERAKPQSNQSGSGGTSVGDKVKGLSSNDSGGLSLAASASVPGATQLPEIGKGGSGGGNGGGGGGGGGGYANHGGRANHGAAHGIETSSLLDDLVFNLEGTYKPPSVSAPSR